ncbi:MAG: type I methionyl aminopeptidase [Candidatus Omnitrophica bacterium]|nr:type I methionyl aminopeptidase [Candidatus Omnitrophota bacterium]
MQTKKPIKIKTKEDIKALREAGKILSSIVKELQCSLKTGITTSEIDSITEKLIADAKVRPAFKGYRGFPSCACVSVNEEVVHGIPSERVLCDGDIVSVDVGIIYNNYYSDMAVTVGIGDVLPKVKQLMSVTRDGLLRGIAKGMPGNHLSDISHAIQSFVEEKGFSVVRDFVGHGIGTALHEEPEIPNFGPPHRGPELKEGMVFAIEPMVNLGSWQIQIMEDGWTVKTLDRKPSAHFEHTVVITENGPEILTR